MSTGSDQERGSGVVLAFPGVDLDDLGELGLEGADLAEHGPEGRPERWSRLSEAVLGGLDALGRTVAGHSEQVWTGPRLVVADGRCRTCGGTPARELPRRRGPRWRPRLAGARFTGA